MWSKTLGLCNGPIVFQDRLSRRRYPTEDHSLENSVVSYGVQRDNRDIICTSYKKVKGLQIHPLGTKSGCKPRVQNLRIMRITGIQATATDELEIRVCTNKTCRKEGALQALDYFRGLAPPRVAVETCGCLGNCGAGPNAVILPQELIVRHCNTASHVARLLERQCGAADAETNLHCLDLKNQGNLAFSEGQYDKAEAYFNEAIALNPTGGIHALYANRSAARVAQGDAAGALEDALEAERLKPGWSSALMRQAEALSAAGKLEAALSMYQRVAESDPEMRRSKLLQRKRRELQSQMELSGK